MDELTHDGARGSVSQASADGETVVTLAGEFDLSNVDADLRPALEAIEAAPGRLVIEASALEFIDSAGLAVLLQCAERLGPLTIRNPSAIFRRVIEVAGLSSRLQVEP